MGVRGLFSFLKQFSHVKTFEELCDSNTKLRIGIDISFYIYRWQANAEKLIHMIESLQKSGHRVLLVFDGRASDAKQAETIRRRTLREEEVKAAETIQNILTEGNMELTDEQRNHLKQVAEQHARRGWQCTREIRHKFKERLYERGIPILKAKGEADWLLTSLATKNQLDIIISGDMDLLVLGCPVQYVPQADGLQFRVFDRAHVLHGLGLGDYQFRSFCAMCSTEYSQQEITLDINQAYSGIRVYKNLETIQSKHESWLKAWPTTEHNFFQKTKDPEEWIREDEMPRYEAWLQQKVMPYNYIQPDVIQQHLNNL